MKFCVKMCSKIAVSNRKPYFHFRYVAGQRRVSTNFNRVVLAPSRGHEDKDRNEKQSGQNPYFAMLIELRYSKPSEYICNF